MQEFVVPIFHMYEMQHVIVCRLLRVGLEKGNGVEEDFLDAITLYIFVVG